MKVAIACDHAGFKLKEFLKANVTNIEWCDEGTTSDARVDYPDFAAKLAQKVSTGEYSRGVLICGSGIGMAIAANKFSSVRAAAVESKYSAKLSRAHNDSNILCLGARILAPEYAKDILETWLNTSFEGGRHTHRIEKIKQIESKNHASQRNS